MVPGPISQVLAELAATVCCRGLHNQTPCTQPLEFWDCSLASLWQAHAALPGCRASLPSTFPPSHRPAQPPMSRLKCFEVIISHPPSKPLWVYSIATSGSQAMPIQTKHDTGTKNTRSPIRLRRLVVDLGTMVAGAWGHQAAGHSILFSCIGIR